MSKSDDWENCRYLWATHMSIEAADRGYDFEDGRQASERCRVAEMKYEEDYGESFDPYKKPEEESFGALFNELGQRVEYAKYLETCRGRGMGFEEWVAERAV